MNPLNQRKMDHINIVAGTEGVDRKQYYFDRIKLTHRALPEIDLADVDPSVTFMEKQLTFPLLISSMTGGSDKELIKINRNLAAAATAGQGIRLLRPRLAAVRYPRCGQERDPDGDIPRHSPGNLS